MRVRCASIAACSSALLIGFVHAQSARDFLPSHLSGLAIWQDASVLNLADGVKVSSWPASGGLAYGASQSDETHQPTFHTGAINGRPAVRFGGDAANESLRILANATTQATYSDLGIGPAGITYFAVLRAAQATDGALFGDDDNVGELRISTSSIRLARHNFEGRVTMPGDYTHFVRLAGTFSTLDPNAANETAVYVDGVASPTSTQLNSTNAIAGLALNIGADVTDNLTRPHFGGDLAELIIWNRRLSATELGQVDAYLQNKYFTPHLTIEVSEVRLCWISQSNKLYQLQYRSELTTNAWLDLGAPILGTGGTNCITDPVVGPRRFYQALVLP